MVRFHDLGFSNFEKYVQHFFETLLPTNKTYDYFVDWNKVKSAVNRHLEEIALLNTLTKVKLPERASHMYRLVKRYPQVVDVIPLLIAERAKDKKINIFDPEINEFLDIIFDSSVMNDENIARIVEFCGKTGLLDLFDEVKDLHDYLLGVEVGIDTNSRKGRSGAIFEAMCQKEIETILTVQKGFRVVKNDPEFSLYQVVTKGRSKGKTHDFVVYKDKKRSLVIECNFYNTTGSKPISIAESYVEMYKAAQENGLVFVWITDGPGWLKMREPLIRAMKEIEWILNFRMLRYLEVIVKKTQVG